MKYQVGDFIVTHGTDLFDRLIQFFTQSYWNHAALIVSENGDLIELVSKGIKKGNIENYKKEDKSLVNLNMSDEDRKQVLDYSLYMLSQHDSYGFLTIFTIALKILTKFRIVIKLDGTLICSEFVARALAQGGVIWDKDPALITPADLYNYFKNSSIVIPKAGK